jgi:ABC-type Mn2+/Zn2+ transport system ATPase subunit
LTITKQKVKETIYQPLEKGEPVICLQDVAVAYQANVAIFDINLDIYPGECLGIVGPNASGKTTLLKTILGVLKPIQGSVQIFGEKFSPKTSHMIRSKISYIPQLQAIDRNFPALVEDVVAMGRYSKAGLFRPLNSEDWEKIYEALEAVGMKKLAKRPIGHLSGGQQQKVMIARALANEPKILLLDEPTTALDFKMVRSVVDLVKKLHEQRALTIVIVSHDIKLLREYCTRIAAMDKKIVWKGDPHDPDLDIIIEEIFLR